MECGFAGFASVALGSCCDFLDPAPVCWPTLIVHGAQMLTYFEGCACVLTGDMGVMDDCGVLHFVSRVDHCVKVGRASWSAGHLPVGCTYFGCPAD